MTQLVKQVSARLNLPADSVSVCLLPHSFAADVALFGSDSHGLALKVLHTVAARLFMPLVNHSIVELAKFEVQDAQLLDGKDGDMLERSQFVPAHDSSSSSSKSSPRDLRLDHHSPPPKKARAVMVPWGCKPWLAGCLVACYVILALLALAGIICWIIILVRGLDAVDRIRDALRAHDDDVDELDRNHELRVDLVGTSVVALIGCSLLLVLGLLGLFLGWRRVLRTAGRWNSWLFLHALVGLYAIVMVFFLLAAIFEFWPWEDDIDRIKFWYRTAILYCHKSVWETTIWIFSECRSGFDELYEKYGDGDRFARHVDTVLHWNLVGSCLALLLVVLAVAFNVMFGRQHK